MTRPEVRAEIGKVKMSNTILGQPVAFDKNGDVVGGVGFSIFKIGSNGSYDIVQKG